MKCDSIKQLIFVFTASCCGSAQFALSMNVDQRMVNVKTPVDEPAAPIYYFSANDGTKLIVDRSLTELCTPLDEHLSDYLTGIPGDPSAGPASFATAQNPLPLSDQIPGRAISAWMAALKILKSNPISYQEKLDAHFTSLNGQQLVDTIEAAHYFELNQNKVAALLGCARHYGADILERTACESFYKRLGSQLDYIDNSKIEVSRALTARLLKNTTTRRINPEEKRIVSTQAAHLNSICYSPNAKQLAGHNERGIFFADCTSTDSFCVFNIPHSTFKGGITLDYCPDGSKVAVCINQSIGFISSNNSAPHSFVNIGENTKTVAYHPQGFQLATGTHAGITLFNEHDTSTKQSIDIGSTDIVRYHPYNNFLFAASRNCGLRMYNADTLQEVLAPIHAIYRKIAVDVHPNGSLVVQAYEKNLHFWDIRQNKREQSYEQAAQSTITTLAFSPTGRILAFKDSHALRLFDLRNNKIINDISYNTFSVHGNLIFNSSGTILAHPTSYGNIFQWDLTQNKPVTLQELCMSEYSYHKQTQNSPHLNLL